MNKRFLQIHFLTSFPASLLNRDDAGFAKRIPFGSSTRTRISSQCLKRHWRTHQGEYSLSQVGIPMSIRSKQIFQKFIADPLSAEGFPAETITSVCSELIDALLGKSEKAQASKKGKGSKNENDVTNEKNSEESLKTKQIITLGSREVEYLLDLARKLCKKETKLDKKLKENLEALGKSAIGLDGALFGRMVTSDVLSRVDSCVHVSHAFTVHAEQNENDYFTAVDDFESLGSAHLDNTELTTGIFYGYVVVDLDLLKSNLIDIDSETQSKILESLIHTIAKVSPGAKLGSTAPYAFANLMLLEIGNAQPCTFANAFLKPVKTEGHLMENAFNSLASYIHNFDEMYPTSNQRCLACMGDFQSFNTARNIQNCKSIEGLSKWVTSTLLGDKC